MGWISKIFKDYDICTPAQIDKNMNHAKHLYTVLIDKKKMGIDRDEFMIRLNEKGIGTGVHYRSIPSHTFYKKKFKWKDSNYKNSSTIGEQTVSLPLSANLKKTDIVLPNLRVKSTNNTNIVKMVTNKFDQVLYISRANIPYEFKYIKLDQIY